MTGLQESHSFIIPSEKSLSKQSIILQVFDLRTLSIILRWFFSLSILNRVILPIPVKKAALLPYPRVCWRVFYLYPFWLHILSSQAIVLQKTLISFECIGTLRKAFLKAGIPFSLKVQKWSFLNGPLLGNVNVFQSNE